jgi:hypothetical protein
MIYYRKALFGRGPKLTAVHHGLLWRYTMPVQMIELEEVTMVDLSDEALEAVVAGVGGGYTGGRVPYGSFQGICC